jgi:L-iditol 2-dehydrogenase
MSSMKAAVLHGREDVRIQDVPLSPPGPGEVQVHIEAALTCGTDLKVFRRGYHAKMIVPPAVFGHEFAGTLRALGAGVAGWAVGDRVVVANSAPCGQCRCCLARQEQLCDDLLFLNGAYAEFINVPARIVERNLLRLGTHTACRDAALTEPLACVVLGVEELRLAPGERVLVIGAGPIGLMFVALAKHLGCDVSVAGRRAPRLEAAGRLGATQVVDVGPGTDLARNLLDQTGSGFDAVVEAVGRPEVWEASVELVRKGGRVNFFGGCPAGTRVSLDTGLLHYSSLNLVASFHHTPRTIRRALALIESGVVRARDFVDGECVLDELPALFRSMAAGNQAIKTLVRV